MTGSQGIDAKIASLGDWRAATLTALRGLIHEADAEVVEEVKWVKPGNPLGVPTWSHAGIICTGETYKDKIKLTFARGASLADPSHLFNSSLEGGTRRAIDIREGESVDAGAFKALVQAAVAETSRGRARPAPSRSTPRGSHRSQSQASGRTPRRSCRSAGRIEAPG